MSRILITGAEGFIGSHLAKVSLEEQLEKTYRWIEVMGDAK